MLAYRSLNPLPRDGPIIFGDLIGKLDVLRIECAKCGGAGQYDLDKLVEKYGPGAKLFQWSDELTADCPRKLVGNTNDPSDGRCPDLSNVV